MTDWVTLSARGGLACHDLVGWMMWDERAKATFADLGMPNPDAWIVAWRLAALGDTPPPVMAAMTYSINPSIIELVAGTVRSCMTHAQVLEALDDAVVPGLESICPGLAAQLGGVAADLWRAVDATFGGARPMFTAARALPRSGRSAALSAWHAAHCIRELRGDNHWAILASEGIDDVQAGLLHSAMIDVDEYGDEEWIARSRGADDTAVERAWAALAARGFASDRHLTDAGRTFRREVERRTDDVTATVWREVGEAATLQFLDLVEPHHDAFVARIDATAGPRWMPAVRGPRPT